MTKDKIQKEIYSLKTEKEIEQFVKIRINYLENNSKETTVGKGYASTFNEYISKNTHYKTEYDFEDGECPDLVYDDLNPYIDLIKSLKEGTSYNELVLFSEIYYIINNYLPSKDNKLARAFTFMSHKNRKLSIEAVSENGCACSFEKAGLAHNMFKFLGIDSSVAMGRRNNRVHAFNLVYPNGYRKEPTIIYDPSYYVNFEDEKGIISYGYYMALKGDICKNLLKGEPIEMDFTRTEINYRHLYTYSGILDDKKFYGDKATYSIGIKKIKK